MWNNCPVVKEIEVLENPVDRKRRYTLQMGLQQAVCEIPTPHGKVTPEDAQDLLGWLEIICKRLHRDIASGKRIKPVPPPPLSVEEVAELEAEDE